MTKLLDCNEVGELVGVSGQSVKIWARRGTMPCIRVTGQTLRFDPADVQRWLESKRQGGPQRAKPNGTAPATRGAGVKLLTLPGER